MMKQGSILLAALLLVLLCVPLAQAECLHENCGPYGGGSSSGPQDCVDNGDGTHTGWVEYELFRCKDCGEKFKVITKTETEAHSIYGGECWECGYMTDNACQHENATVTKNAGSTSKDGKSWIDDGNGLSCSLYSVWYDLHVCDDCGYQWKVENGRESATKQNHDYRSGVCYDCKYACLHEDVDINKDSYTLVTGEDWEDDGNGKTHSALCRVYDAHQCNDCWHYWIENEREEVVAKEHDFWYDDDGSCEDCDYVCPHDNVKVNYNNYTSNGKWTDDGNGRTHSRPITRYDYYQCEDCVVSWRENEREEEQVENHWGTNICSGCGCEDFTEEYSYFSFNKQPSNIRASIGEKASTSIETYWTKYVGGEYKDYSDKLKIAWYYKNPGETEFKKSSITGKTYSVTMTEEMDGRIIYCVLTDTDGRKVYSAVATIRLPETKITKQPSNAVVDAGEKATVSISATGEGLTYAWYYSDDGGVTFEKSTIDSAKYSITATMDKNGRQLYCIITDVAGKSVQSRTVTITVKNVAYITKQPVDTTAYDGEDAVLSVEATGDGLTYTWYYKNVGKSSYSKSSVTTPEYATTMSADRDGRMVYCLVKDEYGNSVKSDVVTLTLRTDAAILTQPKNASAANGEKVKVTINAEGDGLTYAWFFSDDNGATFTKSSLTGKTYSVTMNADRDGRLVYCVIADQYGNSIQSETVTLTAEWYADIVRQPVDATAFVGEDAVVSVEAKGDGLTYTWYYKNAGKSSFSKSSVTTPEYATTMSLSRDGRQIYCKVTDQYGNSTKSDVVTVSIKYVADITSQPVSKVVSAGESATFSVKATGDGRTYAWYYSDDGVEFKKSSVTKSSYTTTMKTSRDGRQIYCVVTDKYGNSVQSDTVTMTLPRLKITKQPTDQVVSSGESATFKVTATGDGKTYAWYYSDDGVEFKKSSVTKSSYTTTMKESRDGRKIYCIVKDAYGASEQSETVTMTLPELKITSQPKNRSAADGESVTFSVKATGDGKKYAWYYSDDGETFKKSSVTKSSYTTTVKESRDGRKVYCLITDAYGNSVKSDVVTMTVEK